MTSGPYFSIDNDEMYLRKEEFTYKEARAEAADWARQLLDDWGRSRYVGIDKVPLHDHEDWEYCDNCPYVPVWRFELYERMAG